MYASFLLRFYPSFEEIEEDSLENSYTAGLNGFYDSLTELERSIERKFGQASTPAERAKFPSIARYTDVDRQRGMPVTRFQPPVIAEIAMSFGAGGIAAAVYSLIKLWVQAKHGRRIRVRLGDLEIEASQLSREEFEKLYYLIDRLGEVTLADLKRQVKSGGYDTKESDEVLKEEFALRQALRRRGREGEREKDPPSQPEGRPSPRRARKGLDASQPTRAETPVRQVIDKVKILFLAANPRGGEPRQLEEEIRQITAKLRAAEHRDSFELVSRWAVRPDDLLQALLEVKPHVVHFSGLGSDAEELIVLDDGGKPKRVSKEALVQLFRTLKDNIRLVVLNACYSRPQAEAIAESIDCTVGMNGSIGHEAAIVFAASFYRALGFGRSVKEAFELGRASLLLEGMPEENTPELLTRNGVDGSELVLIAPPVPVMPGAFELRAKQPGKRVSSIEPGAPASLFYSYSHKDEALRKKEAFTDIARGIREVAKGLVTGAPNTPTPAQVSTSVPTPSPKRTQAIDRTALVRTVSGLSPDDMAMFVTLIEGAATHIGRQGTVREQAADLIRWAESSTGPGLEAVQRTLEKFR